MRIKEFGILLVSLFSLVLAHNNGIPGAPRVLGYSGLSKPRLRRASSPSSASFSAQPATVPSKPLSVHKKHRRQEPNIDGPCGKGVGPQAIRTKHLTI